MTKTIILQFVAAIILYFAWLCIKDYRIKTVGQEIAREEKLNICTKQSKKYYINLKSDREKYYSSKGFIFFAIIYYILYYIPIMYYVIKRIIKSII